MAILFDWYEDPRPSDKQQGKRTLHPRIRYNGTIGTDLVRQRIQERCSLTETDVTAVLDALSHILGEELADGKQVHLDGIGYFQITLQATEPVHSLTTRADKVKLKSINFQADRDLKSLCMSTHLRRSKYKPHSASLSEEEIDKKLTAYFATHPVLTRSNMQSLCSFTQSMASRQIRRLKAKGNLQNIGKPTQPIYIPTPGHYEK